MEILDVGHQVFEKQKRKLLVQIHCFALMPNHYHLLLSPLIENGVSLFMKKLNAGYTKYFNNKYKRTGTLWQGKYKSVPILHDSHFNFIPYYIHLNPLDLYAPEWREGGVKKLTPALTFLEQYRWSSHQDYYGLKNFPSVTQRDFFSNFFSERGCYKNAITQQLQDFRIDSSITLE